MKLGVKELRLRISEVLERVSHGEEVTILKRGRPAARIVPAKPRSKRLPPLDDFRASLHVTGKSLSQYVIEERDQERR